MGGRGSSSPVATAAQKRLLAQGEAEAGANRHYGGAGIQERQE